MRNQDKSRAGVPGKPGASADQSSALAPFKHSREILFDRTGWGDPGKRRI